MTDQSHIDQWADAATEYVDGTASPETVRFVEAHIHDCPICARTLQGQLAVAEMLRDSVLVDPPQGLEAAVFAAIPVISPGTTRTARRSTWTTIFWQRSRTWVPAAVAIVALIAAVTTYSLLPRESGTTTDGVAATESAASTKSAGQSGDPGSTAAPTLATETPSTTAGATTTAAAAATTTTLGAAVASTAVDREAMIEELRVADSPVFIAFERAASGASTEGTNDSSVTADTLSVDEAAAVMSSISELTQMEPLEGFAAVEGVTFAAYVSLTDVPDLVDLVKSIGESAGIEVSLANFPPAGTADLADGIQQNKVRLPVLKGKGEQRTEPNRVFTTSTLDPNAVKTGAVPLPDDAGTHVLVVFLVRR